MTYREALARDYASGAITLQTFLDRMDALYAKGLQETHIPIVAPPPPDPALVRRVRML